MRVLYIGTPDIYTWLLDLRIAWAENIAIEGLLKQSLQAVLYQAVLYRY